MLSIIIPVYNAESYIGATIEKILSQSYRDYELILVNDGSSDNSGFICDDYARKDCRLKVIHTVNKGASAARNIGIKEAVGEMMTFIDADDDFSNDYLLRLIEDSHKAKNPDFVIQGMRQIFSDHTHDFILTDNIFHMDCHRDNPFFDKVYLNSFSGPYCKLFKRSIIADNNIDFSPQIIYGEDFDFILRYLALCKTVVTSSVANYYYIMHVGSVSSKIYSFKKELSGMCQLYSSFGDLRVIYSSNALGRMMSHSINDYMWRLIYSNYKKGYKRSQRIENLKSIPTDILCFFNRNYSAPTTFTKIVKYLLTSNNMKVLDLLLKFRLS